MKFHRPPRGAVLLLKILVHPGNRSTVLGDLEEEYRFVAEEKGRLSADLWYIMQVFMPLIQFMGSYCVWSGVMLKSYFKTTYRSMLKNKMFSGISIISLSVAIACSLSIFVILDLMFYFEAFHVNADRIFQIKSVIRKNEDTELWGNTPVLLGNVLKNDFPPIKRVVRIQRGAGTAWHGSNIFNETLTFVDSDFLEMFSFPQLQGGKDALAERNSIVLHVDTAEKYFGSEDPMNEQLEVRLSDGSVRNFIVRGIMDEIPVNSSIFFTMLVPYVNYIELDRERMESWERRTLATLIEVDDQANIPVILDGLKRYVSIQNEADSEWQAVSFNLESLLDLTKNANETVNSLTFGYGMAGIIVSAFIGLFLLMIAVINYLNIAIASNTKRLKEIALRKVLGTGRAGIMRQFIGENVFLSAFALLVGVFLTQFAVLPLITLMLNMREYDSIFISRDLWIILIGIILFTGIFGGAYPAFYISRFRPVQIIRGKVRFSKKNPFTRILLVTQFVLSFMLISLCVVIRMNADYQRTLSWGYDQFNLVVIPVDGERYYDALRGEIRNIASVTEITGSVNHVGRSRQNVTYKYKAISYDARSYSVGAGYLESLRIPLQEGRYFDRERQTDMQNSIVINERFAEEMGWSNPLSEQIDIDGSPHSIIGVTRDFHYANFMTEISPVMFRFTDENSFNYLLIRTIPGEAPNVADEIRTMWSTIVTDEPYLGFIQDETMERFFRAEDEISVFFGFFAVIALVISCMGLFGLVSLNIARRTKEIGIRKSLGAEFTNLFKLLNRPVMVTLGVSTVFGGVASFFAINAIMDVQHVYHMDMNIGHIMLISVLIFVSALITVFWQVYRASNANPVDSLRYE